MSRKNALEKPIAFTSSLLLVLAYSLITGADISPLLLIPAILSIVSPESGIALSHLSLVAFYYTLNSPVFIVILPIVLAFIAKSIKSWKNTVVLSLSSSITLLYPSLSPIMLGFLIASSSVEEDVDSIFTGFAYSIFILFMTYIKYPEKLIPYGIFFAWGGGANTIGTADPIKYSGQIMWGFFNTITANNGLFLLEIVTIVVACYLSSQAGRFWKPIAGGILSTAIIAITGVFLAFNLNQPLTPEPIVILFLTTLFASYITHRGHGLSGIRHTAGAVKYGLRKKKRDRVVVPLTFEEQIILQTMKDSLETFRTLMETYIPGKDIILVLGYNLREEIILVKGAIRLLNLLPKEDFYIFHGVNDVRFMNNRGKTAVILLGGAWHSTLDLVKDRIRGVVYIPPPDRSQRTFIIENYLKRKGVSLEEENIHYLVANTACYSRARLVELLDVLSNIVTRSSSNMGVNYRQILDKVLGQIPEDITIDSFIQVEILLQRYPIGGFISLTEGK